MKKIIFAFLIQSAIINLCIAQKIDKPKASLTKIEIYNLYGNIEITGTNSDQIEVELLKHNEIPEKFLEYTKNKDYQYKGSNSNIDLNLIESGTVLSIYPGSKQSQFSDYIIKIPKVFDIKINNKLSDFGGIQYKSILPKGGSIKIKHNIIIENFDSNIEIETFYADITAKNISGPIVANSFHGDMKIEFNKLNQKLPNSIETFEGDIDISLSSDSNCDITLNTFKGKYKSQFQINETDTDYRPNFSTSYSKNGEINKENNSQKINRGALKGKINKGGVALKLKTHTGNINLLKH